MDSYRLSIRPLQAGMYSRVAKPTKGMYIVNGKKVVIK